MELSSPQFLFLFLPAFLGIYLLARPAARLPLVVLASLVFLAAAQVVAVIWLGGILLLTYIVGLLIVRAGTSTIRGRAAFWLGLVPILLSLCLFKFKTAYGTQGLLWLRLPPGWVPSLTDLAIPIGLSYVVFQAASYLTDVSRGVSPPERRVLHLAAYLLFFPKMLSGPLVRYEPFAAQLPSLDPSMDQVAAGLRRFLIGFMKRTLVANQMAAVVAAGFDLPSPNLQPLFAWLALLAFTLQIFFDFSGYTDMALGLGMTLGVRLPENFNHPYVAESISDFWRRWHISLATWFRQYVFYPLERHRLPRFGQQVNTLLLFFLVGLWHGFLPVFIVWGLLHGTAVALESASLGRWLRQLPRPLRHMYTLAVILLGWVFFRSPTLQYALGFLGRLAGNSDGILALPFSQTMPFPFIEPSFVLAATAGLLFCIPVSTLSTRLWSAATRRLALPPLAWQLLQDGFLMAFFLLALAASFAGSFAPNLYAKF